METLIDILVAETERLETTKYAQVGVPMFIIETGGAPETFGWLEGATVGVDPEADAMRREVGFKYLFSNFKSQRRQ